MIKLRVNLCLLVCVIRVSECLPWFHNGFAMPASGPSIMSPFQSNFAFAPLPRSSFKPIGSIGHRPFLEPGSVMHSSRPTTLIRTHGIHNLSVTLIRLPNKDVPAKPTTEERITTTTISPAQRSNSPFNGHSLNADNAIQNLQQRDISIRIPSAHQQPASIFIQSHGSHPVESQVPQRSVVSLSVLPSAQITSAKQTVGASFPQEAVKGHGIAQQTRLLSNQADMQMSHIEKQNSLSVQPDRMHLQQTPVLTLNISLQDLLRVRDAMELERQNNELPVSVPRRQIPLNLQNAPVPIVSQMSSGTDIASLNDALLQQLPKTLSPLQETPFPSSRKNNLNGHFRSANAAEQFFPTSSAHLQDVPAPIKSQRPNTIRKDQSGSTNINVQFLSPTSAILQEVQGSVSPPWSSNRDRSQSVAADTSINIPSPTTVHLQDANRPVIPSRSNTINRSQPGSAGGAGQFVSATLAPLQEVQEHVTSPWSGARERGQSSSANTGSQFRQNVQEPALSHWSDNRMLQSLSSSLRNDVPEPIISSGPNTRNRDHSGSRESAVTFPSSNAASRQDFHEPVASGTSQSGSPDISLRLLSPNDRLTGGVGGGGAEMEQEELVGGEEPPFSSTQSSNINAMQRI